MPGSTCEGVNGPVFRDKWGVKNTVNSCGVAHVFKRKAVNLSLKPTLVG